MAAPGIPGYQDIMEIQVANTNNVETTTQLVRINGREYKMTVNGMRDVVHNDIERQYQPFMVALIMMDAGMAVYVNGGGVS